MKKTGTREWSDSSVNLQLGCEHGCRYCYARHNAVMFRKWCTDEQWLDPVIIKSKVTRSFLKRAGIVMFPTTHDITMRNIMESVCVLRKLLEAGNKVLLVSKPNIGCISNICEEFQGYLKQLIFRFTIGSMDNQVLSFWEPNAPCFEERWTSLIYAFSHGYRTSVSCEPFLDGEHGKLIALYERTKPYINTIDGFWIGKLRKFDKRVDMAKVTSEEEDRFVKPLKAAQTDESIWAIYTQLQNERIVQWKDSIRAVIEREPSETVIPGYKPIDHETAWGISEEDMPGQEPKDHFAPIEEELTE